MEYLNIGFDVFCVLFMIYYVFCIATDRTPINTKDSKLDKFAIAILFSYTILRFSLDAALGVIKILS